MSMRSSTSPRRVYPRAGSLVCCYGGIYFGPKANTESAIDSAKEVRIEVLDKSGGKSRIKVTQKVGSKPPVVETWNEKHLTFEKRAAATA
jgi:hypothetical protein